LIPAQNCTVRRISQGLADMYRPLIVIALMLGLGFASSAQAEANKAWRIVQSAGDVRVTNGDDEGKAIDPRMELPEGAIVTTGANGRAVISRGQEQVIIQPLTRLVLTQATPGATTILQSAGSALYRIGKKKTPHFQVDTPYLAAIVKGTAFKVTVDRTRSDVSVTEGAVQVATLAGSAVTLIRSGMSATVSAAATSEIGLVGRNGTQRTVTANEGGWGNGAALLRTGTRATPEATGTNLAQLRGNTIGIQFTSTHDHEALRLNGASTTENGPNAPTAAGQVVGLRQATADELFGPASKSNHPRLRGMGKIAQDAANAVTGKVDATMRTISRKKPLKVTATVPWTEMYMGLFALMGLLVLNHIRKLRIRTKKLEGRS
jgi:hypothetical protein